MTSRLGEVLLDCPDPDALATFWCAALGWVVVDRDDAGDVVELMPAPVPDEQRLAELRAGTALPAMLLLRSPDPKRGKNRVHLDLSPIDCSQEEEVARLLALGATHAEVGQTGEESWTVLADPAGNEFCVLRSLAEGEFSLGG